jgi:hypothetical protein
MSAADSKERRAERAAASAENAQYRREQKEQEESRKKENDLYSQGRWEQGNILNRLDKEIKDSDDKINLLAKQHKEITDFGPKIGKGANQESLAKQTLASFMTKFNLSEQDLEDAGMNMGFWKKSPASEQLVAAKKLVGDSYKQQIDTLNSEIAPKRQQREQVISMTPTEYHQYRREPKPDMIGKGTESTFKEVTVLHPVTKKQFKIHDAKTLEEALATGATIVQ